MTTLKRSAAVWVGAALLAATPATAQSSRKGRASHLELTAQVDQVAAQVKNAEDNLRIVETQYASRPEPTYAEAQARRFSDGEIQYLLGDYKGASVLFYDLISDNEFRQTPRLGDALYYLADSLYQQQNFIGSRLYLRELLGLRTRHYRDALARYLEIAGRLNEFEGIDAYITQAKGLSGGELPSELAYVYGKWLFKRPDLPQEERVRRARGVFQGLAEAQGSARLQAQYFLAVALVQERKYDEAIEQFRKVTAQPVQTPRELKVKELANLSLGRLLYEVGKFDEAIDRYQEIPQDSGYFVDSLYEIAWTQVKKGQFDKAKNATDILLLVAPESTIAPEARILQGHLLLKLKKYEDASETYTGVINAYAPVRDEIDALLTVNKDPVAYFDNLLARNDRNLDVTQLLPPVALKWATTQREVADAVRIVDDLELGRRGVVEGQDIANRILKALDERGLETFPELQEGYTRADAVDSALTRADDALVRLEGYLLKDLLTDEQRKELDALRAQKVEIEKRFAALPTTQAEVESRKKRLQDRVDAADRAAFKLGNEIQAMYAAASAMQKWVEDTRRQRKNTPEEETAFLGQLQREIQEVSALEKQLDSVRRTLRDERETANTSVGGEGAIRTQYEDVLRREHDLLATAEARLDPQSTKVLERAHTVRTQIASVRGRVGSAKGQLRDQVTRRGQQIREKVLAEQKLLDSYNQEVASVSGDARNLVGRIAFDSFRRVRQQFYDLVLKADVGVVDVAFTRKQDRTENIQKLSQQKDRELRALDEEFKEVLKDVD